MVVDGVSYPPLRPLLFSHAYEAHARVIFAKGLGISGYVRGREGRKGAKRRENFVSFIPLHSKAVIYARVEVKRNASERRREREKEKER